MSSELSGKDNPAEIGNNGAERWVVLDGSDFDTGVIFDDQTEAERTRDRWNDLFPGDGPHRVAHLVERLPTGPRIPPAAAAKVRCWRHKDGPWTGGGEGPLDTIDRVRWTGSQMEDVYGSGDSEPSMDYCSTVQYCENKVAQGEYVECPDAPYQPAATSPPAKYPDGTKWVGRGMTFEVQHGGVYWIRGGNHDPIKQAIEMCEMDTLSHLTRIDVSPPAPGVGEATPPECDCGKIEHGRHHSECPASENQIRLAKRKASTPREPAESVAERDYAKEEQVGRRYPHLENLSLQRSIDLTLARHEAVNVIRELAAADAEIERWRKRAEYAEAYGAGKDADCAANALRIAELERRVEEVTRIGKQFEDNSRKHFDQSCINLKRAEEAEAKLASLASPDSRPAARGEGIDPELLETARQMFHYILDGMDSNTGQKITGAQAVTLAAKHARALHAALGGRGETR
jgi:hypothetical protein